MVGITSYGAYVPVYRLSRDVIAKAWSKGGGRGERSVAHFDEDSVTMAVTAGCNALCAIDRSSVDALFVATSTSPYREKLAASIVATALDLGRETRTADFGNSLRAGTIAINSAIDAVLAGSAKNVLVTAADVRMGLPQGDYEQNIGDGAAALTIGTEGVVAEIEHRTSVVEEIHDVWRTDKDEFVRAWEDRFVITQGYERSTKEVVAALLEKSGLKQSDFAKAAIYGPEARSHPALLKGLEFKPEQVVEPPFGTVGNTGAANAMLTLTLALENAKPGDRILFAGYGDGADAFVLRVTDAITKVKPDRSLSEQLAEKRMVPTYEKYLLWRQMLPLEPPRRPDPMSSSPAALFRERKRVLALYGQQCTGCGTIQYHPLHMMRVCSVCSEKDKFEWVRLSDRKGEIYTFTLDNLAASIDPPVIFTTVDFQGGGRIVCEMTDVDPAEVKVGMSVEMCFRKLFTVKNMHTYFWKSKPAK
jgi:3-hydroxy-3-methylglutaryl CoA synthase